VLDNLWSSVFALAIYSGAYLTEISVPASRPSARAYRGRQGDRINRWQRIRFVIIPLMFRIVLPSLGNTFISLFKDTSLASAIAVPS
jgi:polar amino acid transport system permease protein